MNLKKKIPVTILRGESYQFLEENHFKMKTWYLGSFKVRKNYLTHEADKKNNRSFSARHAGCPVHYIFRTVAPDLEVINISILLS